MARERVRVRRLATWLLSALLLMINVGSADAQDGTADCFGGGDIAGAVIGTFLCTLLLLALLYFLYNKFWLPRREKHLVLESDPEKGDKYAFDNPCFRDVGLTPIGKALDKSGGRLESGKSKWNQWSPLGALVSTKNAKKKTVDDTCIENTNVRVVSLRSHDFTGLGFNIFGNMRDGIFIKDVLHRGPASESGKLNPGDRINSVQISFEHMVYEDALTILSYASPYEVRVEVCSGGKNHGVSSGQGAQPRHPLFKSSSSNDLLKIGKSAKQRLFQPNNLDNTVSTEHTSLNISSANTTLERSGKQSPRTDVNNLPKPERTKKNLNASKPLSTEQLKTQLEHSLAHKTTQNQHKVQSEIQTAEPDTKKGFQKFGVRVLPVEMITETVQPKSPKSSELSQNDNNINIEKISVDEVDMSKETKQITNVMKRDTTTEIPSELDQRNNILNSSGIKRDKDGIPQEIPEHMLQAAVAARRNRRSIDLSEDSSPKKPKGKAPAPPEEKKEDDNVADNLDEISRAEETPKNTEENTEENTENDKEKTEEVKEYCSDSDMETDNQSSVNTIELNSSDITVHHSVENSDAKGRKTASTGDLSKLQRTRSNTGTLERAQSLDITDSGMPPITKKRKATKDRSEGKLSSDEESYDAVAIKEPRLSLALDGLDTFQRNRLKKSSEWGNLEDVVLNLDKVELDVTPANSNEEEIIKETRMVKNLIWPTDLTDEPIENSEPKSLEPSFSLKAQFQEKLNDKLKLSASNDDEEVQILNPPNFKIASEAVYNVGVSSQDFIAAEKFASTGDTLNFANKLYDTNISDDIKVSRHSLGSLERPKSDVLKSVNKLKMQSLISSGQSGISNITITENGIDKSELYTTALDSTLQDELVIQPEIKNITITETITDSKYFSEGPSSLTIDTSSDGPESIKSNTLTFITEIQVTPENKLPEMKFTTSSYERTPEKKVSQIELLRSNFEKSPPKTTPKGEISPSKSRIPIATSKMEIKMSPERRELKFDDGEEMVAEIMSSAVHSTPKNPPRNVTVTSIRTSSKIPSGQHTSVGFGKPPVPLRPNEVQLHETRTVASNGNSESSFKQWVFNPSDESVTNIILDSNKDIHK